ncbi:MAG: hypothetical protein V1773_02475 [bacterium]
MTSGLKLPIVLGVTGHRDLREKDIPILQKKVSLIFSELEILYPHSSFILLSALAEGADRLVAKEALKRGIVVNAPLPLPIDEYIKDFTSEQSQNEFLDILSKCAQSFVVNNLDKEEKNELRDYAYQRSNIYIALHSQILIALWDGVENNKVGGSAEMIRFKSEGIPQKYLKQKKLLSFEEKGLVYIITTPRLQNTRLMKEPFLVTQKKSFNNKLYLETYRNLDSINKDIEKFYPQIIDQKLNNIVQNEPDLSDKLNYHNKNLFNFYIISDFLATIYKKKYLFSLQLLFLFIPLGIILFEFYNELISFIVDYMDVSVEVAGLISKQIEILSIAGYLMVICCIAFLIFKSKRKEYHRKYLDYRALAEGLRVQCYWDIACINEEVSDHYLLKQSSELDWIKYAIRTVSSTTSITKEGQEYDKKRFDFIKSFWIDNQKAFFNAKYKADSKNNYRFRFYTNWLLGISIVNILFMMVLALSNMPFFNLENPINSETHWRLIPIFFMTLLLALVASIEGYSEKRLFREQSNQYRKMLEIFENAAMHFSKYLQERTSENKLEELILEIGKEALNENADWVVMHRSRPIEFKIG